MKLTFRELLFWYRIMEREIVEKGIIHDRATDKKPPLGSKQLRREVDKKLRELKSEVSGNAIEV